MRAECLAGVGRPPQFVIYAETPEDRTILSMAIKSGVKVGLSGSTSSSGTSGALQITSFSVIAEPAACVGEVAAAS